MGFIALVFTFLLEQLRPLPARHAVAGFVEAVTDAAERNLNAGRRRHGMLAWLIVVGGSAALVAALYAVAWQASLVAAFIFNVAVLYVTIGFRQFSHPFTAIQIALAEGNLAEARRILTQWRRDEDPAFDATELPVEEVTRQAMERGLILAHRDVFGVFFWFVLLPGPAGPVLYRTADYVARRWNRPLANSAPPDRFGEFAARAFAWIDWLPARLTALGFAIVGDFEGAVYCWRQAARNSRPVAGLPAPDGRTLLLAATSGAIGQRLMSATEAVRLFDEPGNEGAGLAEPDPRRLQSGVALVWRALILWLVLLLLMSLAGWLS